PPPNPVTHVPDGPAGVMVIEVACTLPAESRAPVARKHSPVCRSLAEATTVVVTAAVVGTMIVWLPDVVVRTVIEIPVAPVTSPLTKAIGGRPDGGGRGEGAGAGDGLGPGRPA